MRMDEIILWVAVIGAVIGGVDRIIGNKFGLGAKFEEGLNTMGPLALAMCGIICLAPVIANVIGPVVAPAMTAIGCDPAIFGSILPIDTGGYPMAMSLAVDEQAGLYSGLIVASMLGCTLTVLIPVGLSLIQKKDSPYYAQGLLIGMISVPFGSVIGGLIAGFSFKMILMNTIPVIVIAILMAAGLKFKPNAMIRGCEIFGQIILIVATVGLVAGVVEGLTGIVVIPGMAPIGESMSIIGAIGMVLLGMVPMLTLITKIINKPLTALGEKLGMDSVSAAGIVFMACNPIPVYSDMYKNMNSKGKIVSAAWMVCAAGALGDHLGFTAGVRPEYTAAVVVGKLLGGVVAFIFALFLTKSTAMVDERSRAIEAQGQESTQEA